MYRKNTAGQFLCFQGVDVTTGGIKSGVTWTVRRCIDGTFANGGGTVAEDGTNGWYKYAMSQADTNGNDISFNFTGSGAVPQTVNIVTTACDPTVATNFGITALPATAVSTNASLLTSGTGTDQLSVSAGKVLLQATQSGVTIPTVTTVTNQLTAAQIATGVWQDATAGDFTVASSIGKSLYTSGNAPGAASGLALVGSNVGTVSSVTGDVGGKVLGGGSGTITGVGASAQLADAVTHGGSSAKLQLGSSTTTPALLVQNTRAAGSPAAKFESTGTAGLGFFCVGGAGGINGTCSNDGYGIGAFGAGTGAGYLTNGGTTGVGWSVSGGATSGDAISLSVTSGSYVTQAAEDEIATRVWASGTRTVTSAANITSTGGTTVPQTGDSFARIGATGSGLTSLAPASTALSTAQWTNTLATNLGTLASHDPGSTLAAASAVTSAALVTAVWDSTISGHTTSGTFGGALNSASSAGDPWNTPLPGSYAAGTAGYIVGTNLDATVSSRLATSGYTAPNNSGITSILSDTTNIKTRLPAALVSGRMDSNIGAVNDTDVTGDGSTGNPWGPA